jgi:hypothetical protein
MGELRNISSLVEKVARLHNYFIEKLNSIIFLVKSYANKLNKFLAYFSEKSIIFLSATIQNIFSS